MKSIPALATILLLSSGAGDAAITPGDKTITIDIPTDLPPPPAAAEKAAPTHPFFAAPNTGVEVMEKVNELEERIEKLEKTVAGMGKK